MYKKVMGKYLFYTSKAEAVYFESYIWGCYYASLSASRNEARIQRSQH